MPKFGGKSESWADFIIGFKAILKTCDPDIEMVRLWNAPPEQVAKHILGDLDSVETWALLDRQYRERDIGIPTATSRLLALKLPKGPV